MLTNLVFGSAVTVAVASTALIALVIVSPQAEQAMLGTLSCIMMQIFFCELLLFCSLHRAGESRGNGSKFGKSITRNMLRRAEVAHH